MIYILPLVVTLLLSPSAFSIDAYLNKYDRKRVAEQVIRDRYTTCMNCGKNIFCGDMYGNVQNKTNLKTYCETQNKNNKVSLSGDRANAFGVDGNKRIRYSAFVRLHRKLGDNPNFYYVRDNKSFRPRDFKKTDDRPETYVEYLNFLSSGNRAGTFEEPVIESPPKLEIASTSPAIPPPEAAIAEPITPEPAVVAPVPLPVVAALPAPAPAIVPKLNCSKKINDPVCASKSTSSFVSADCSEIRTYNTNTTSPLFKKCTEDYIITSLSECSELNSRLLSIRSNIDAPRVRRDRSSLAEVLTPVQDPIISSSYKDKIKKSSTYYTRDRLDGIKTNLSGYYERYTKCNNASDSSSTGGAQ